MLWVTFIQNVTGKTSSQEKKFTGKEHGRSLLIGETFDVKVSIAFTLKE